ncbi:MAG: tetratricopeptide repeat protein [Gammaproteobacteria bacterium]
MKNRISYLLSVFIVVLTLCYVSNTVAAEEKNKYLLTEEIWNKLSKINELLESGQSDNAINQLNALSVESQGIAYNLAVIQQTLGHAYISRNDYLNAISAFKQALNLNALPVTVVHNLEFNLAQLLIYTEKYKEGLDYFNRWVVSEPNLSMDVYILAGTAYYESKQYKKAIPYAKKVIDLKSTFDETWHQILLSCYLQTSQYENAAVLLESMLTIQPNNKSYWQQLLAIWQKMDNDQKILATMELMYTKSLFDAEQIRQLVNMYLYKDLPYKAANLLKNQIESGSLAKDASNWELLSNCWLQAQEREKAVKALIEAVKLSDQADLHFRIGQIYFDLEEYPQATIQLKKALSKDHLTQKGYSQLLLGISQFHQKNYTESQVALQYALENKSINPQAKWWLERIDDLKRDENVQTEVN